MNRIHRYATDLIQPCLGSANGPQRSNVSVGLSRKDVANDPFRGKADDADAGGAIDQARGEFLEHHLVQLRIYAYQRDQPVQQETAVGERLLDPLRLGGQDLAEILVDHRFVMSLRDVVDPRSQPGDNRGYGDPGSGGSQIVSQNKGPERMHGLPIA